jgi:hypothetical protein
VCEVSKRLAEEAIVAKINGEFLWDMHRPLEKSVSLEIKTFDSPEGKKVYTLLLFCARPV